MAFRILIAPDSFKECMSAVEAADAMERGARTAAANYGHKIHIDTCPISDGGEGFAETLRVATRGRRVLREVRDPTGQWCEAGFIWCGSRAQSRTLANRVFHKHVGDAIMWWVMPGPTLPGSLVGKSRIAVIESAEAVGLHRVPAHLRDPEQLSSYGVGELIGAAMEARADVIIVGLGGSATCDGGVGMARALGVGFERVDDPPREDFEPGTKPRDTDRATSAQDLPRLRSIDMRHAHELIQFTTIIAAYDVDNPLYGPDGAARVYAPQKGATPEQVARLEEGLRHLARKCRDAGIKADPDALGAGAAGGLGFGLAAFCSAELRSGAEIVLEVTKFKRRAKRANLVLTGEGRFDAQSLHGKACMRAATAATSAGSRVIGLMGAVAPDVQSALASSGGPFESIIQIAPTGMSTAEAIRRGPAFLEQATRRVVEEELMRVR